jgi:hypothetical protein
MLDMISALQNQNVRSLSVSDGIEMINLDHTFSALAKRIPEGYVFASLDAVALDVLCSRYMFKTVPAVEARRMIEEGKASSEFLQRVPLPVVEGSNIVTGEGFDSPISRDISFERAEERGFGTRTFHVVGEDVWQGGRLASVQGHLGKVSDSTFSELITQTLYYDASKPLWDLQTTVMGWARATDELTGSSYARQFLEAFDEDGDGIIRFEDQGRKGFGDFLSFGAAYNNYISASGPYGRLQGFFMFRSNMIRWSNVDLNVERRDFMKEYQESSTLATAMAMSRMDMEAPDPFFPSMTWGKGKWPSIQAAHFIANGTTIYGRGFPYRMTVDSLYGVVLQYALKVHGKDPATADSRWTSNPTEYVQAVAAGAKTLPFTLYVPEGYGRVLGKPVPNVVETRDPEKVLRAEFGGGTEVW